MLRDELLRSKHDEIARCLLSRKRKLSELYFATVGIAGATEGAAVDSVYQPREQLFLDANDLSKGRYFNEATLPPLPDYAALVPRQSLQDRSFLAEEPEVESGHLSKAAIQSTGAFRSSPCGTPLMHQVADVNVHFEEKRPPSKVSEGVSAAPLVPALSPVSGTLKAPAASLIRPSLEPVTRPTINGRAHELLAVDDATGPLPDAIDFTESLESPLPERRKRPSVVVGPPSTVSEQPVSPASSVGPYSTNTPAPVAVSPDTSPADEIMEPVDKPGSPTAQFDRTARSRSAMVPSTPDEQLRLEQAQSLQNLSIMTTKGTTGKIDDGKDLSPDEEITGAVNATEPAEVLRAKINPKAPVSLVKSEGQGNVQFREAWSPPVAPPFPSSDRVPLSEDLSIATDATPASSAQKDYSVRVQITSQTPPQTTPQAERMTTRVSSGAIRHKSVSEILGETPKPATDQAEMVAAGRTAEWSRTRTLVSPTNAVDKDISEPVSRLRFQDTKGGKERSKLSTVVFPRQQHNRVESSGDLVWQSTDTVVAKMNEEQDYLFTLFQNKAYSPPRSASLTSLLASAHKTLTTANQLVEYEEQMNCRTLRKIYALQNANRWPLRQLKRSLEPGRRATHWDILLDHMKWMRTDFREERKWKLTAAKNCADWCVQYVNSEPDHRAALRVRARIPTLPGERGDVCRTEDAISPADTIDTTQSASHPTPDLVPSMEDESVSDGFNDDIHHDLRDTVAPAALFSLPADDLTFSLDMTPVAEKLLQELPVYFPVDVSPETKMPTFKSLPDSHWKTDLLPISKYAVGRIVFHDDEPPKKRCRYDYSQYRDGAKHAMEKMSPEQVDVALFQPENKQLRDRIHPGHSFRPPTEHPMPSVGFFESRQSSQWTYTEDDELRRLVKEYSYNWSLIASCLASSSRFTSGAERRTPWECFERWIGLEGLPADMSKTQYFRAYSQRLETAQRTVLAQQQAAQQLQQQQQLHQGNNAQPQPPIRRRTTQPVRVDRRRSSRHLALLDAMRKLAKKRETMLQKQQHASHLASLRKVNEANQPKPPITTPSEFSRLKFEREMKLQERQEQYRQQMIAHQRASLAAQRAGQMPNQQAMSSAQAVRNPNGMPHNSANPGMPLNVSNGIAAGLPAGVGVNHPRAHSMQGVPTGAPVNGPMPNGMAMKVMPQAGMQSVAGARPSVPIQTSQDNARVIREATRLQEQQRMLQSRQQQPHQPPQPPQSAPQQFHNQQQFLPQGPHSPNLNLPTMNGTSNNTVMAAFQSTAGMQSPSFHSATSPGVSTPSPRLGQPNPLSSGVVPTISSIQAQIQRNNPNMSPEQVNKLATERLHQYQQQRMAQAAMNAAAGNMGAVQANFQIGLDGNFQAPNQPGILNGAAGIQVPPAQGYSPLMRVAQTTPHNRVSSSHMNGAIIQESRSVTPQTQRSGSVQASSVQMSSKSPHPPQAQMATT